MQAETPVDFFISYATQDSAWADWIAWVLDQAGYSVFLQKWHFVPGTNWAIEMQEGARRARQTLLVLTPTFFERAATQPEWAAAFARDPTGRSRPLIPVRVAPVDPPGMLGQVIYIDLVGLDEGEAEGRLLQEIARQPGRPAARPAFPGSPPSASPLRGSPPPFPPARTPPAPMETGSRDAMSGPDAEPGRPDARPSPPSSGGPSPFTVGPPILTDDGLVGRHTEGARLVEFLDRGGAVELLGARRMGRTSLLNWLDRSAPSSHPSILLSARDLAGRSPEDLVGALAHALGREGDWAEARRRWGDAAAERFFDALLPLRLLIDDAHALAARGHGFDGGFFDLCRSACQRGRLQWVSTARGRLGEAFAQTGLSSAFLNDARSVWVGALTEGEARAILGRSGASDTAITLAYRAAGGIPLSLQWLGERLWRGEDGERAIDHFALAFEGHFKAWWRDLSPGEQRVMGGCVTPQPVRAMDRGARIRARGLVERGLLREEGGEIAIEGEVWRDWVADVG